MTDNLVDLRFPTEEMEVSDLISLNDASRDYGVTTQTLRRWADAGKVRMVKPDGHHVFLNRSDLDLAVPHVAKAKADAGIIADLADRVARLEKIVNAAVYGEGTLDGAYVG